MQNFALGGFSAEQFWQCINAPVDYATFSFLYHAPLRRNYRARRYIGSGRRLHDGRESIRHSAMKAREDRFSINLFWAIITRILLDL
jgi:hypothetical protein